MLLSPGSPAPLLQAEAEAARQGAAGLGCPLARPVCVLCSLQCLEGPFSSVSLRDQVGAGAARSVGAAGEAAENPSCVSPPRLKKSQDPVSEPPPAPGAREAAEDLEGTRPALSMCGPICPSRLAES